MVAGAPKLQARQVIVQGLIAFIDAGGVVLNVGTKSGLKAGDRLSVERVIKEIKDPATGAVLRRMSSKIGMVEVTELDEGSAVARIVDGSGFKVGDVAKTVTQ